MPASTAVGPQGPRAATAASATTCTAPEDTRAWPRAIAPAIVSRVWSSIEARASATGRQRPAIIRPATRKAASTVGTSWLISSATSKPRSSSDSTARSKRGGRESLTPLTRKKSRLLRCASAKCGPVCSSRVSPGRRTMSPMRPPTRAPSRCTATTAAL